MNLDLTDRSTAAALSASKAALGVAEASLAVVKSGARPQEREQAEQQVRAAKANVDKLKADLARMQELLNDQAISPSQFDQAKAAHEAAEASYRSALEARSLIMEGARAEDVRRAELAVQQARDGLAKAQADRALVEVRRTDVANAKVAASSAREGVEAAVQATRQARASLALAENALTNAYVRSPVSGYLATRIAEPGQQVGSGAALLRIVAPGSVYFQASVPESQYAEVGIGQPVDVTVDALPGESFRGSVSRVFPVASAATRSFTLRVDFQGDGRLRPQMFARGRIVVGTHPGATVVPKDAVIFRRGDGAVSQGAAGSEAVVFVVGPGDRAVERRVTVGYSDPTHVEILSGVRPGERVVTAGNNALQDGDPVNVR
jgi:RND family efflux transporter MFP subunit